MKARRDIPVVIRKGGFKFVPTFLVDLEPGDQLIVAQEMRGYEVPKGKKVTVNGYSDSGPIFAKEA